jgi:hypothetical protein
LSIKLPPAMRHALLTYCIQRQMSFGEAIRIALTRLFADEAVTEAAETAAQRAWLQEYETKQAEREALLAGIERGQALMAQLGDEGFERLLDMVLPIAVAASQSPDKQLLPRVMADALPAAMQAVLADKAPAE